jgi:two-component system KDP operon response regulator KdpE
MTAHILVVDDVAKNVKLLADVLAAKGFRTSTAASGEEALERIAADMPDLVLLDVMMPELDGYETLRIIRETSTVPVIMLTVRDEEEDKVRGLELGADDYVTKPFSSGELLARLRAALRHVQLPGPDALFVRGPLEVDLSARVVRKSGQEVKLTPTEYALLRLFVTHAGKVLTHRQLLTEVWGPKATERTEYLRVHIAHLRDKIESDPARPELILTEPGIGYRLQA